MGNTEAFFEALHPLQQRLERPLFVGPAEAYQCNLEVDAGVRRLPHVDEGPTQRLQGSRHRRGCHLLGNGARPGPLML